jgi:TRAP-type C4-dicarboxylate transport system permease small subunit
MERLDKVAGLACKAIEITIVALLAAMVLMVFGNVVLRYGFNSGIVVSEELSRWGFVWLTFLGAILGIREGAHLGTDMLVGRLGPTGKKVCLALAELLMVYAAWLLLSGSFTQMKINVDVEAPTTGWSMAILYASGVAFAIGALIFHLLKLGKLASGRLGDSELVTIKESEDVAQVEDLHLDGSQSFQKR